MAGEPLTPDWVEDIDDEQLQVIEPNDLGGSGVLQMRDYQEEAVNAIYRDLAENRSALVVMATGLGKTVVAAETILRWPCDRGRVLFVAHRRELIDQAAASIGRHIGEDCGIEMGERKATDTGTLYRPPRCVVASVQSLSRINRLKKFDPRQFGLIIFDEAHHATASSYATVIGWFQQNRQCRFLGITATPDRTDSEMLGQVFDVVSYTRDINHGIREGWLVPVRQAYVTVEDLDFSQCRTTAGDLNEQDLERVMAGANSDELGQGKSDWELTEEELEARRRREVMLHKVVDPTLREAQGRPTIVFGVTRQHAAELAMMFRRYGVRAEAVVMDTPLDERAEIIRQFKAGTLQVLCGVGVFTEGFDAPNAAVIVVARPTKSRALYTQMVGRGTRPLPAALEKRTTPEDRRDGIAYSQKPVVTVLDFVGASGRHKLITTLDILGDAIPVDLREAVAAKMRVASSAFDPLEEFAREEQQREAMRQAREREEQERKEALLKRQREIAERIERERQNRERARAHYTTQEVDPFGSAAPVQRTLEQSTRGSITDKQLELLKKLGVSERTAWGWSKGQAGAVIDKQMNLKGSAYRITFGKHAGKCLAEVPMDYVQWLANTITDRDRKAAFQAHVDLMITERELAKGNRR